ncbi:probable 39S ribosomal protein L45, mitochondrial [Trichonephila inaurata madagascariensis]|uniref:Large ribosomal subunit protein mL45 n=1 Tax=Trichonephila inaurata madagascariensis TaxID=2747483 RepID=A0A8X6INW1_9ARAC|nr:probable 39S ribosomal protein L45, mitochondrial [Trichonephila inaurata madagascariensis]
MKYFRFFNILRCLAEVGLHHQHCGIPIASKERGKKVIKVKLPDFEDARKSDSLSIEEIRAKLKEKGIAPPRNWNEKPLFMSCTGAVVDAYVPPEGDGKISAITGPGMKQMYDFIGKKGKSFMALRRIRDIDYEFDLPTASLKVQDIYIEAQKALAANDEDKLHDLVTEKAFPEMFENVKNKTIVWKFIQQLEHPRIVHIRTAEMGSKDNMFAQITVRLHTQQILAIYDRFGRLMHGSEDTVKDVLEYVVLEKHLTLPHSTWKIHGKIIPDWMPPKESIKKTYYLPDIDKEFPEPPEKSLQEGDSSKESQVTAQST